MNAHAGSTEITAAKKTAKSLQDAASALDILVHDYIVITGDAYTSAREAGCLKGCGDWVSPLPSGGNS